MPIIPSYSYKSPCTVQASGMPILPNQAYKPPCTTPTSTAQNLPAEKAAPTASSTYSPHVEIAAGTAMTSLTFSAATIYGLAAAGMKTPPTCGVRLYFIGLNTMTTGLAFCFGTHTASAIANYPNRPKSYTCSEK